MERFADAIAQPFGLASQLLGWSPEIVWDATPSELAMALTPPTKASPAAPSREQIQQMMERDQHG